MVKVDLTCKVEVSFKMLESMTLTYMAYLYLLLTYRCRLIQKVANITPKDFSPPPFRYFNHIRIPSIKEAEMRHMKNFIEAMGGSTKGLTKRNKSMKVYG